MISKQALDFRYLLLEYYKDLRINETDLIILLFIEHLILKGDDLITPDLLNLQSNIDLKIIDEAMVKLVNKGLLEFSTKQGKMVTSLNPLRSKLQELFLLEYERTKENGQNVEFTSHLEEVINLIADKFGRSLSPIELQSIHQWFAYGYTRDMVVDAIEESVKKKRYNIKAVDKLLLKQATAVDIKNEGVSAQDDRYRKNIKNTLTAVNSLINEE